MQQDRYFGISTRIARWKLNTPFENWLACKADYSERWKYLYILYYRLFDRKYYKGGQRFIHQVLCDLKVPISQRKDVAIDMMYCLHRFGISFQDYSIYDFQHHTSLQYRNSFVADKLRYHYCDLLNDARMNALMTNKYECYLKYKPFFKREVLGCFSVQDFNAYEDFLVKHTQVIYKPLNEHSGHGISIIHINDIDKIVFFQEKIQAGPFILEELIIQGEETSLMHPQSVNSCRVVTFTFNNEVHILGVTWRIGSGDSIKDNAGSGGMYVCVNPSTGRVITDAINYKGEHFQVHPDSQVVIEGYQLPKWDEALQLIRSISLHMSGTTLIAWDIAYSVNGWLMVEANENGDWSILQSNMKLGKKAELYSYMDQYFKKNSNI